MRGVRGVAAGVALSATLACTGGAARPGASSPPVTTPPVTTAPTSAPASPTASATPSLSLVFRGVPGEFYGVLRGRIAAFDTLTGRRTRWLTDPPAGAHDGQPTVVKDDLGHGVVFVRTTPDRPCGTARVLRVPVDGGRLVEVYRPRGALSLATVSRERWLLAYAFSECGGDDGRIRVRVVSLRTGAILRALRSEFRGEGLVSVSRMLLSSGHLVLRLGIHQQSWLVRLDVFTVRGEQNLDDVERLRVPKGCVTGSAVFAHGHPDIRRRPELGLRGTVVCPDGDGYRVRLVSYASLHDDPRPERGPVVATRPETYELTGSDLAGHFIGLRGEDDGRSFVRRVFQQAGDETRVLADCTMAPGASEGTAAACVSEPVW